MSQYGSSETPRWSDTQTLWAVIAGIGMAVGTALPWAQTSALISISVSPLSVLGKDLSATAVVVAGIAALVAGAALTTESGRESGGLWRGVFVIAALISVGAAGIVLLQFGKASSTLGIFAAAVSPGLGLFASGASGVIGIVIALGGTESSAGGRATWAEPAEEPRHVARQATQPVVRLPRAEYFRPSDPDASAGANPDMRYCYGDGRTTESAIAEALDSIRRGYGRGEVIVEAVWIDRRHTTIGLGIGKPDVAYLRIWRSAEDAADALFVANPDPAPVLPAPVAAPAAQTQEPARPTKVCPDCAETVLGDARICRFCRHEFWAQGEVTPGQERGISAS